MNSWKHPFSLLFFLGLLLIFGGAVSMQAVSGRVIVSNFPKVQEIKGTVNLIGRTAFVERKAITVPPTPRDRFDADHMVDTGLITTKGYRSMVFSFMGKTKGGLPRSGEVGMLLLPETEMARAAFNRERTLLGSHLVKTSVAWQTRPVKAFFSACNGRVEIAFPQYRVFLYNTSDRTTEIDYYINLHD